MRSISKHEKPDRFAPVFGKKSDWKRRFFWKKDIRMLFFSRDIADMYKKIGCFLCVFAVVPLAGTWIEIRIGDSNVSHVLVVPLAGTWIEINDINFG